MSEFSAVAPLTTETRKSQLNATRHRSEAAQALWKDTLKLASMPKVVDLTGIPSGGRKWIAQNRKPDVQYEQQRAAVASLSSRFKNLEMPTVVRLS